MECRLRYVGNWAPVMEWRQVSGEMENEAKLITDGITSNTSKYTVVSTLTVQRKETRSKYMCTTRFNANGRPRSTTATNVPEYSYNWTYPHDTLHTSSSKLMTIWNFVIVIYMVSLKEHLEFSIDRFLLFEPVAHDCQHSKCNETSYFSLILSTDVDFHC